MLFFLIIANSYANTCSCIYREGFYKQITHKQEMWWGDKVEFDCDYECSNGTNNVIHRAQHKTWYLGKEDGDEIVCEGTIYKQKYSDATNWFYWQYSGSKAFSPKKSHSADLKNWARENCY